MIKQEVMATVLNTVAAKATGLRLWGFCFISMTPPRTLLKEGARVFVNGFLEAFNNPLFFAGGF